MLISYNWLQTYFEKELPSPEEIEKGLTMHSFEIEGVEKKESDVIFDVKVLPNRAHDCLCHSGIAKEISAIFDLPMKFLPLESVIKNYEPANDISLEVNSQFVNRFKLLSVRGVSVGPSPEWLKNRIEAMGGRSINNIVDITNFVMFEIGQPMHAFDADKLARNENGQISLGLRESVAGEKIKTLDGVERVLPDGIVVIEDKVSSKLLGIAGIKGGGDAEISDSTKNIILESANFDSVNIRKSSKNVSIRTDASIRFENGISKVLPDYAIDYALYLVEEIAMGGEFSVGGFVDYYPKKERVRRVGVSLPRINEVLGTSLTEADMVESLKRLHFKFDLILPKEKMTSLSKEVSEKTPDDFKEGGTYEDIKSTSDFTHFIFAESGVPIPRKVQDQLSFGYEVQKRDLMTGDLVFSFVGDDDVLQQTEEFLQGQDVKEKVNRVGVYIDGGFVAGFKKDLGKVVLENIDESEYAYTNIYRRMSGFSKRCVVDVPPERLDINIPEDLVEEVGRIRGLENVPSRTPSVAVPFETNKLFYYSILIRDALVSMGYSEVYNYAMEERGSIEIENPIASDKKYLRVSLLSGIKSSLEQGVKYSPLLGFNEIKIFEIGTVFPKNGGEHTSLAFAVDLMKKGKDKDRILSQTLMLALSKIEEVLGVEFESEDHGNIVVVNLTEAIKSAPTPDVERIRSIFLPFGIDYKTPSQYPFVLRDIAIFVPAERSEDVLRDIIVANAGPLLVKTKLFDRFEKDGKISFAFRLVFQSYEKTLTDEEVNLIMEKINTSISGRGWQVR